MQNVEALLKRMYLFSEFAPAELALLADKVQSRELPAGHSLYSEGSEAKSLFIIQSGTLRVTTNSQSGDDVNITTMGAGEHFGELPFLDGERRSANIEAVETAMILELPYDDLKTVLATSKDMALRFYQEVGYFLVKRLRALTNDVTKAREIRRRFS